MTSPCDDGGLQRGGPARDGLHACQRPARFEVEEQLSVHVGIKIRSKARVRGDLESAAHPSVLVGIKIGERLSINSSPVVVGCAGEIAATCPSQRAVARDVCGSADQLMISPRSSARIAASRSRHACNCAGLCRLQSGTSSTILSGSLLR